MPVTLLMGRSPAGENATGASDFKHWYDSIAAEQQKSMTPKLLRLYSILARGTAPMLSVEWHPLQEPTEREREEIKKLRADRHKVYIDGAVLFPEEVALAEFGKNTNGEIEIDESVRRESLKAEKELVFNPPAEPTVAAPAPGQTPPPAEEDAPAQ